MPNPAARMAALPDDKTAASAMLRRQRETTAGDDSGRRQRETTAGDDSGRRQRETTAGDDSGTDLDYAPKVIGAVSVPAPATAKVYIWGMGDEMQGLLRFVSVGADDYVVSLPFGGKPVAGFYPAAFSKVNHTPGKLNWRVEGSYGTTTELAFVTGTPSQLIGVNGRESVGEDRVAYSWKAEVLSGDSDEFVGAYIRAIAGFTEEDFTSAIGTVAEDVGTVRLLAGVDTAKTKFIPFLF